MMKLLCICHANICRSLMAQEFFKQLLPTEMVFSRGLYADPSLSVPAKVQKALAKHNISITEHTPTPLAGADLQLADLIFCMEQAHEERLLDRYPQFTNKIWLITDFALEQTEDLPDPIALEGHHFEKYVDKLYQLCQKAAERITNEFKLQG